MVLIIDRNKKRGQTLAEIFHFMGVLSLYTQPSAAASEISSEYRAVLISEPEELPDPEDYTAMLRSYSPGIPIFAISREPVSYTFFDGMFQDGISSSVLVSEIVKYQEERGLPSLGQYLLAGLDAGCDLGEVRYFSEALNMTKTETMIIRYLIATYPTPASSEKILKHTHKPTKLPERSSIRTHISKINSKFEAQRGRSLIVSVPGEGYTVLTPELANKI